MDPLSLPRYLVVEVHNFGGFFGGDTVTLSALPLSQAGLQPADSAPESASLASAAGAQLEAAAGEAQTLVIDEKALENIVDRYKLTAGMVLALGFEGERIDHAWLLGAASHAELREALGPVVVNGPLAEPLTISVRCEACGRWVPESYRRAGLCPACGA